MTLITYQQSLSIAEQSHRARTEKLLGSQLALITPWSIGILRSSGESLNTDLIGTADSGRLTVIRFDGVVLFDSSQVASSMSNHRDRPELLQARALGIGRAERFSSTLNQELLYVAKPVWSNNALIGFVRVATPTALMEQAAIEEARRMALMSFLLGCLLLAAFAFYNNRQIQALKEIESSLHALTEGNFSSRAHLQTNQAFIATFQALNQLARKLQSQKEAQLADDAHFETVVETLKEGILLINEDQRIELINPSAARLLEVSSERLQGHPLWGNLALGVLIDLVDNVRTSGRPARQSLEIFDRTVLADAYGVASQSSARASTLVVLQDITERTRMDEMREDFMRSASHELRTPLTAIQGFVHTIIEDPDMPPSLVQNMLSKVSHHTSRLTELVNDLSKLNRVNAERMLSVSSSEVDVEEVVRETLEKQSARVNDNQLEVEMTVSARCRPVVMARSDVKRMVEELLDNALRHAPESSKLSISLEQTDSSLRLSIEDQGPGVPEQARDRVFERFFRLEGARDRMTGGSGLGLAIVKSLCESIGGKVWVTGGSSLGANFVVELPN